MCELQTCVPCIAKHNVGSWLHRSPLGLGMLTGAMMVESLVLLEANDIGATCCGSMDSNVAKCCMCSIKH